MKGIVIDLDFQYFRAKLNECEYSLCHKEYVIRKWWDAGTDVDKRKKIISTIESRVKKLQKENKK